MRLWAIIDAQVRTPTLYVHVTGTELMVADKQEV